MHYSVKVHTQAIDGHVQCDLYYVFPKHSYYVRSLSLENMM